MTLQHNSDKIYMQGHKTYRFNTQCIVWHFVRVTPSSSRPFALLHHMTLSIIKMVVMRNMVTLYMYVPEMETK